MLEEGSVIAGRYRLESLIGEGAMGEVWKAQDDTLKRNVAIKMLFVRPGRDTTAMVDQFLREARIAASVQHRNVIQTVDFGVHEEHHPFMVMELLDGESLEDRIDRPPAPSAPEFVQIVSLTLRGLAAVHDAGIVHRDLKPANIFLQREPEGVFPKILDFGISRSLEGPSAIKTQEGLIIGTPDYMSPEQARGEADIDRRSDIYSMGVILYQGLAGRLPFEADTVGELIVKIVTQEPPPLKKINAEVPSILSDVVAQAMARDREHRFVDARVMRTALSGAVKRAQLKSRTMSDAPPSGEGWSSEGSAPLRLPMTPPARPAPPAAVQAPPASPPGAAAEGRGWGDFDGSLSPLPAGSGASGGPGGPGGPAGSPGPSSGLAAPHTATGGAAVGLAGFIDRDPFDAVASAAPAPGGSGGGAGVDDRLSLDLRPRDGQDASAGARPAFGSQSLSGAPAGGRGDESSRLDLDYDRGVDPARQQAKKRRPARRAAPRPVPYRRRRPSRVPLVIALLMLGGLLYAPRVLLGKSSGADAWADAPDPANLPPGRSYRPQRRQGVGKQPPALRDVAF